MRISASSARPPRDPQTSNVKPMNILPARADDDNEICLPSRVTASAPDCAISCIQAFIARSFNSASCRLSSDLDFLCTTVSSSGFTLGEGGFQCVLQSCGAHADVSIYDVCSGISGAQPRTWETITATITPSSSAGMPSPITRTSGQTGTAAGASSGSNAFPTSTSLDLGSLGYTTANVPFPAPTAASLSRPSTNVGQTIGIALGSLAGVFGLIGIILYCCRPRKKPPRRRALLDSPSLNNSRSTVSSSQGSRGPTPLSGKSDGLRLQRKTLSPVESITAAVEAAQAGITGPVAFMATVPGVTSRPTAKRQKTRSYWRKSIQPEDIGLAVSPREGANFVKKTSGSGIVQRSMPMVPIPESSVLPGATSPTTTTRTTSEQIGERMSHIDAVMANAKTRKLKFLSNNYYSQEKQVVTDDLSSVSDDTETRASPSPPAQTSLFSSARASLTELGTILARSVSLSRKPSDAKPLLPPATNSSKEARPAINYPSTPKYDNGYFDPNAPLPTPATSQPTMDNNLPGPSFKIARKPTFSSFVAGKLLPPTYRSPPAKITNHEVPPMPHMNTAMARYPTGQTGALSIGPSAPGSTMPGERLAKRTFVRSQDSAEIRSPVMIPAPLTIRKSRSSRTVGAARTTDTLGYNARHPPNPPLPAAFYHATAMNTGSIIPIAPRKVLEMMGLGSPTNVLEYAQKPLPKPNHAPNLFPNLASVLEPGMSRAVDRGVAAKEGPFPPARGAQQGDEPLSAPLSATTSWLSVPVSSPRLTAPGTAMQTPSPRSDPESSVRSPLSVIPRGNPGFPSLDPSLSSIYTKYKYSRSQLPSITPTSAITLTAATYNPTIQPPRPMPTLPYATTQTSFLRDPSPAPGAEPASDLGQMSAMSRSEKTNSDIQSNISTPQRFTKSMNPYNPYFSPSPTRQMSTASSGTYSMGLSSHPTMAPPQFAVTSDSANNESRLPAVAYQRPSFYAGNQRYLGSRHTSELLSPDSADPGRESLGLVPKIVVTPNRTPGGDLVLTVDTTGKGYGL